MADRQRDTNGRFIKKGVADSTFGAQIANNAIAPKVITNLIHSLTPIEAYELCSAVRSSIRARNEPFGQVKIRLFTKSGEEILGGEIYQFWMKPNECQSGSAFIQALSIWNDLAGERPSWIHTENGSSKQLAHVLNPFSLRIDRPQNPRLPEHIQRWQYIWENGRLQMIPADEVVFEHDFNPSSLVRGNSPLYAVVNSITASYQAQRYIKSFFANNAVPGGMVNVESDNPDIVEPFKKEFLSAHQGEQNAWKLWFTYGAKTTFTPLEHPVQDAPFQQLVSNVRDELASLYMVPPLHGGMWDKTRFDSVGEQNNFFFESVFLPRVEVMQGHAQRIMDEHLRFSSVKDKRTIRMSKSVSEKFEKARGAAGSDVVVVLDCDHIPAVSALKQHKINYAQKLQDTLHLTPREAAAEVGLDVELGEAADFVWFNSNQKYIDSKGVPAVAPVAAEPMVEPDVALDVDTSKVKDFYRSLRKLTLDRADAGSHWSLNEADTLAKSHGCDSPALHKATRKDFAVVRSLSRTKDKEGIKKYFNNKTKNSTLKTLVNTK